MTYDSTPSSLAHSRVADWIAFIAGSPADLSGDSGARLRAYETSIAALGPTKLRYACALADALTVPAYVHHWSPGGGPNPYLAYLALAASIATVVFFSRVADLALTWYATVAAALRAMPKGRLPKAELASAAAALPMIDAGKLKALAKVGIEAQTGSGALVAAFEQKLGRPIRNEASSRTGTLAAE